MLFTKKAMNKKMHFSTFLYLIVAAILHSSLAVHKSKQQQGLQADELVSIARGISIKASDFKNDSVVKLLSSPVVQAELSLNAVTDVFSLKHSSITLFEIEEGLFRVSVNTRLNALSFEGDLFAGLAEKQWKLFALDIVNPFEQIIGWSDNSSYLCGEIFMLGGYNNFAKGEVKKTFGSLPPHQTVRIIATYYFIDQWVGESAFMRLNSHLSDETVLEYVWTDKFDTSKRNDSNPKNICGNSFPEYQLSANIDVAIPHNKDKLTISFGSTLETEDPSEASFGVASIHIYLK